MGLVLVVAIGIALGASVLFFGSRLTHQAETARDKPDLALALHPNEPEATVIVASPGLDWVRDLRVGGACAPTLNGGAFPLAEGTAVATGDVLACPVGQTLTIASSPDKGNSLLFRHTF